MNYFVRKEAITRNTLKYAAVVNAMIKSGLVLSDNKSKGVTYPKARFTMSGGDLVLSLNDDVQVNYGAVNWRNESEDSFKSDVLRNRVITKFESKYKFSKNV